jgi:hypothetical protein
MKRFLVLAALLLAPLAALRAAEPPTDTTAPVALATLPPALQGSIQAQVGNGTLGEIYREDDGGEVNYTVEITRDGRARAYTLDESGALTSVTVYFPETPPAVQRTIQTQIGIGAGVQMEIEKGVACFDVEWKTKEGAAHSLTVWESGKLESVQVALEETPPAVSPTIVNEIGKGQLGRIMKTFEDDGVYYEVEVTRDGKDRDFSVAESGKLDSRQVCLAEVPPAARKTIEENVGNG